jgi:hypothetical protein
MAKAGSRPGRQIIPADKARQGDIILRTPLRRVIFIAGLGGAAILGILLGIAERVFG